MLFDYDHRVSPVVLGTESGAFYIQGKYSTTEMHLVLLGVVFVSEGLIWLSRLDLSLPPECCDYRYVPACPDRLHRDQVRTASLRSAPTDPNV